MPPNPPILARAISPLRTALLTLSATLLFGSMSSKAASLSLADPYNVFIFGDMTESNVDSEGRVAVGGNANLTHFGIGSGFRNRPQEAGTALVVGGNLTYNGGEVHYGSVLYAGSLTGSVNTPNGKTSQGRLIDFVGARNTLLTASQYWAGLPATGQTIDYYGGVRLIGTDSQLNVFNLSGSLLSRAWGLTIDVPAGSTVLVNIDGDANRFANLGISFSDLNGDGKGVTDKQKVLYNFYEATSLTISGISVQGSLLAPNAAVDFGNGNIEGNLIAQSLKGSGEAHQYLFNGNLPEVLTVPEPSVAGILVLAILLAARRRR